MWTKTSLLLVNYNRRTKRISYCVFDDGLPKLVFFLIFLGCKKALCFFVATTETKKRIGHQSGVLNFCFLQFGHEVVNLLTCIECGEGITSPLKEEQIVLHIAALLKDIDRSVAKRFLDLFLVRMNEPKLSYGFNIVKVDMCPHCISMEYIDWLSTYELPLQFWMGVMALPSISQPFVLQVRQFADARLFPVVHKDALRKIDLIAESDASPTIAESSEVLI